MDFVKKVWEAGIRAHPSTTAIEDMERIATELEAKVKTLLMQRAYDLCPYRVGDVLAMKNESRYAGYHRAFVRRIHPCKQKGYDLQVVPLTKRLKAHKKYGSTSNHIWHWQIHKWKVIRQGWTMEKIDGKTVADIDEKAQQRQNDADSRGHTKLYPYKRG
jgi:hypothetical protein